MYDNIKRMEDIYLQHRQGYKKTTPIKKNSSLSSIGLFIRGKFGERAINKLISLEKSLRVFSTVRTLRQQENFINNYRYERK